MVFNSLHFLIFFPIVVSVYYLLPHRRRWILLLAASLYFYMSWKPEYVLILLATIINDYTVGRLMTATEDKRKRLRYLLISLGLNLGLLFTFKYYNFFCDNLRGIFAYVHAPYEIPYFKMLLPVGISFYVFQSLSYAIEVYRGNVKAEKNIGLFAVYVMFFPQLVAGPIERPYRLLPQFREKHEFNATLALTGLRLMLWGMFKKVVIADQIAPIVDSVYNHPHDFTGVPLIVATVLFAFQIYCDFSGYSDIAIGAARIMGFRLMKNFDRPYFAKSVAEFWKRWHISLSTWFRDYLYIPMGGSRVSRNRWYFNLFFTFLVSGIWHGANWTFVIWGALNGFYMVFSIWTTVVRHKVCHAVGLARAPGLHKFVKVFITFALTCFAWVFFRARNLSDAGYVLGNMFPSLHYFADLVTSRSALSAAFHGYGLGKIEAFSALAAIGVMEFVHVLQRTGSIHDRLARQPAWLRWTEYYALAMTIILFGNYGAQSFIYFQF